MATTFPAALDAFTNPSGSDRLNSVSVPHADQHANANDAIEALQVKVGIDNSAEPTSLDARVAALESGSGAYEVAGAVATHEGAPDPHPQYLSGLVADIDLDTDNVAVAGDLMSYSGLTGKMTWLKSVEYVATAGSAITGAVTAGTYASTTVRDTAPWTIQEVAGIPGYDVQISFSTVENFNEIRAYMRYQGGGSHLCEVALKNGDLATWSTVTSFNSQNGLTDQVIAVDNGPSYIASDGSVTLRFYHPITGNSTAHFLYLDYVALIYAVTGGGGVTDHRALSNRLDAEAHPASAITVSGLSQLSATDVQAALLELNTEKVAGSGVTTITASASAPGTPVVGDLWIDLS